MTDPVREPLPHFPYHPDAVANRAVVEADIVCDGCGKRRLYRYFGSVLAPDDHANDDICPWCVADGTAARVWQARFGELDPDQDGDTPPDVADRVLGTTPGYLSWNSTIWPGHHRDVCVFLRNLDTEEDRRNLPPAERAAIDAAVLALSAEGPGGDLPLDRDHGPEAYLFQCRHCAGFLAYAEMSWQPGPLVVPPYPGFG